MLSSYLVISMSLNVYLFSEVCRERWLLLAIQYRGALGVLVAPVAL